MLILLRLAFAIAAFFMRLKLRDRALEPLHTIEGVPIWICERRSKRKLTSTGIGTPVQTSLQFALHPESWFDRILKFFGLASELETPDADFNQRVFIASDHPLFAERIAANAQFQKRVVELFRLGFKRIRVNGNQLSARIEAATPLSDEQRLAFARLSIFLLPKLSPVQASGMDPFLKKALLAEAVTWGIATFGVIALIEWTLDLTHPYYPRPFEVVKAGIVAASLAIVVYFWVFKSAFRRSTRMRGVLRETGLLALITFPLAAIPLVSDINIELDRSQATQIEAGVLHKELRISRSRKGGTRKSYYLEINRIEPPLNGVFQNRSIQVTPVDFDRATEGGQVTIHLRQGRLHIPWISQLDFKTSVE